MSTAQALQQGRDSVPVLPDITVIELPTLKAGDSVTVAPVDYGRIPVSGRLLAVSAQEIVIGRKDPATGEIMVHFPASGFEINPA